MGRKSKFTDEQIVLILKESEAGAKTGELCRGHGITEKTFYRWRAKHGGMSVDEARRLKKLLAESMRDREILKAALSNEEDGEARVTLARDLSELAVKSVGRACFTLVSGAETHRAAYEVCDTFSDTFSAVPVVHS